LAHLYKLIIISKWAKLVGVGACFIVFFCVPETSNPPWCADLTGCVAGVVADYCIFHIPNFNILFCCFIPVSGFNRNITASLYGMHVSGSLLL